MKDILNYFSFSKKKLYSGVFFLTLSEVLNILIPIIFLTFSYGDINFRLLIYIGIGYFLSEGISALGKVLITINSQESLYSFRKMLWKHIISLPVSFFDSSKSGRLVSHFLYDSQLINDFYFTSLPVAFPSLLGFILSLIFVFIIDWKLSLILLFSLIIIIVSLIPIVIHNYRISSKIQIIIADISDRFKDSIQFIKIIKTNSSEDNELIKGEEHLMKYKNTSKKQVYITSLLEPLSSLVILLMVVLIVIYLVKRFENNTLVFSETLAVTIYLIQMFLSGTKLSSYLISYSSVKGVSSTLKHIISLSTEKLNYFKDSSEILEVSQIKFEHVNFSYETSEDNVLEDINFSVSEGDIIVVVGEIGSGKSTIFYLISRLYDSYTGNIYVNTDDIKNINIKKLRDIIGYVPQAPQLFDDTIENNIIYNYPVKIDNNEIINEIKQYSAYDFIREVPKGYQTKVGEGNHQLSGGQQQLINIARTIFNPSKKIILLDEITSNLDPNKEDKVKELIKKNSTQRITFFITHRILNVDIATKILFLDNGKVSGFDTHTNLYEQSKKYRNYYDLYAHS